MNKLNKPPTLAENGVELVNGVLHVRNPIAMVRYDEGEESIASAWIGSSGENPPLEAIAEAVACLIRTGAAMVGEPPEKIAMYVSAYLLAAEAGDSPMTSIYRGGKVHG